MTGDRRGVTLLELIIALTVGLVVIASSLGFAATTFRTVNRSEVTEGIERNARYLGVLFRRDLAEAGVGLDSRPSFGTLQARGDTIVVLKTPFDPLQAPARALRPPPGPGTLLPPGGTCGPTCLDLELGTATLDLAPGDLATLQVNTARRLIVVSSVQVLGDTLRLEFFPRDTVLLHPGAFAGGLQLARNGTSVQKLAFTAFWHDSASATLHRAERFDAAGTLVDEVVATRVRAFDARLVFTDGDELATGSPTDADDTNDWDDIRAIRLLATLAADRADPRINGGVLLARPFEWLVSPRNLTYERNRL